MKEISSVYDKINSITGKIEYYFKDLYIDREYGPFETENKRDEQHDIHFQQVYDWIDFLNGVDL